MSEIQTATVQNADATQQFVRQVAWQHRYLAAIQIGYCVAALATATLYNDGAMVAPLAEYISISSVVATIVYGLAWSRGEWLVRLIPPDGSGNGLPSLRVLQGLFTIVLMPMFIPAFSVFKRLIPVINPYEWDARFATWDAALHGGTDPWRLLHPLLGHPAVTIPVDMVYGLWFFVVFGAYFWQAFSITNPERRMQFLLAFILSWIVIGTIFATLLSSAGPVYIAQVTGEDFRYGALLNYLHHVNAQFPLMAVQAHDMLWQTYQSGYAELGHGISAMPSMHVALSVLTLLLFWRSGGPARTGLSLFTIIIFLGSIHLAWHYAIDGYVAAVMAVMVWKASAQLARMALMPERAKE